MIAAVSAILGVTGALLSLAIALWRTERDRGNQKARGDALDVNLTGVAAQLADMTNRFNEERQRGDRLDDVVAEMLAAIPVAGAYQRLLQIATTANAARGDRPRVVPAATGTDAGLSTALLEPGRDP